MDTVSHPWTSSVHGCDVHGCDKTNHFLYLRTDAFEVMICKLENKYFTSNIMNLLNNFIILPDYLKSVCATDVMS